MSMARFDRVAPILPVRDVTVALAHYEALGFAVEAYEGDVYGFIERDGAQLHVGLFRELDPLQNTFSAYLYVDDVDAVYVEWQGAKVSGRLTAPKDTPYGLREMAHVDDDGNLLRVGSTIRK